MRAKFLLLSLVSLAAACTSGIYGWTVRTNSTNFAEGFRPTVLEGEPVGILEAVALPSLRGSELGLAHYLAEIMASVAPSIKVLSPRETANKINTQGLTTDYVRMRGDLEQSNILEAGALRKIGTGIGVRYVFQPRLAAFTQTMIDRWSFADVRIVQTRSSILRCSLQLWDTRTGEQVWASVAEAILSNEAVSQDPVFLEDAARIALGSIIADFMRGKTASTYTPLNKFLDDLIRRPEPEKKP